MKFRLIYFVVLSALTFQCAKQTSPSGGPTDETPPELLASLPRHEQTNVKSSKLELYFNEAIQLNNPREQIIITPTVGKKFETTFNKRKVTLDLNTELQENTTYSINFREAIQDLTEKNSAVVKIAFSTGSYIDSLSINGKVIDALTEKTLANYTVALAEASDTFNIFKHQASWITATNKKGFFSIENLKPGSYVLYAFNDKSKNLIVDSKSEQYAFLGKQLTLTKNIDSLQLRAFKLDVNNLKLITARTTFAYFNLRFSKSLVTYQITSVDSTFNVSSSLEPDLTTIKLYNTIPNLDSLQIRVTATDSLNTSIDTLLYMKFPKKESTRDKFTVTLVKASVTESNSSLDAEISFTKPVTTFNLDSTFIEIDSVNKLHLLPQDYRWGNNQTLLTIVKKVDLSLLFPPDSSSTDTQKSKSSRNLKKGIALVMRKGATLSVENDTAKAISAPITFVSRESTATIEVKVETTENFLIQILNKAGKIIDERLNQKNPVFENLTPDTYLLRLAIDSNKNGKWDAGNFETKTEPEPILYYRNSKGIKGTPLKANWIVGPLLITY